jgi:type IV pilus assembly protein PilX
MKNLRTIRGTRGNARRSQSGVILVVTMLFLIMLTLIGTAAINMSTAEERMARGMRDYNVAIQAAEAALRDAQFDILNIGPWAQPVRHISGQSGFNDTCDYGLCKALTGTAGERVWEAPADAGTWLSNLGSPAPGKSQSIGTHTGTYRMPMSNYPSETLPTAQAMDALNSLAPVPAPVQVKVGGVSRQPRYLIEAMPDDRAAVTLSAQSLSGYGSGLEFVYRVSSIGFGSDPNTRVVLQMMYKP